MPAKKQKLRALTGLSLRKSADPKDAAYEEWFEWAEGDEFDPPAHMKVEKALERGIVEVV